MQATVAVRTDASPGQDSPASHASTHVPGLSTHERLIALGLLPQGRATEFAGDLYDLMARTPLFSSLSLDETRMLGGYMQVFDAPAGLTLINEGDAGDFMLLLMSGMVDVLRRNRYNYPSRIAVAHAGHALGEMSMFDGEPRFASCVTLEQCRMAVLTRESLTEVLANEAALGNKILLKLVQLLSERLRQTSAKLVSYLEAARDA